MKNLKRYFFYFVAIWCVMCLFIRCYMNMAGFQTGRTAGNDIKEITLSGSLMKNAPAYVYIPSDNGTDQYSLIEEPWPAVELNFKYGITEHFDLGVSIDLAKFGIIAKHNFYNWEDKFSLGGGIGTGFAVGGKYFQGNFFASYHPSEKIAIYLNPGFNHTFLRDYSHSTFFADNLDFYGANIGLLFGGKRQFGIDFGVYEMAANSKKYTMLNLGVGFKFLSKKK